MIAHLAGDEPMMSGLLRQERASTPRALGWIVAAILLILHGTAPLSLQLPPAFERADATPAFSANTKEAQRGTLPRVQSRAASVEANTPKAPQRRWSIGGEPSALPPHLPETATTPAAARRVATVIRAAKPRPAARLFDPRGPPPVAA